MGGYEISLSCHAFALLSRAPCVCPLPSLPLFAVRCSLSMHCYLCPPAVVLVFSSGRRCFCVYYRFTLSFARIRTFYFSLATFAIPADPAIGLDCVFFIHCIIITRIFPSLIASLLDAVISVVLAPHDLIMLLLTYPSSSGDWRHVIRFIAQKKKRIKHAHTPFPHCFIA
jgi:hypothetical protein